jgi:lipopolysaccharide transport system permease protein/teichoic acid transport system permease protein
MVPEPYRFWFELNPIYYITQGYRDSLIDDVWFWEKPKEAFYFWGVTICFLFSGALIFRKLRPHFADVL